MRRMIENIERWKVNLSDWMDISIDKIYRYTEPNYSYKDSKRKIENLEVLKILDNQDDINLRQKNDAIKYLFSMIPTTFILYIFLFVIFPKLKLSDKDFIFLSVFVGFIIILFLIVVFGVIRSIIPELVIFIEWLISRFPKQYRAKIKWLRKLPSLLPLTIWPLFFSDILKNTSKQYGLGENLVLTITLVSISSFILWLYLSDLIKSQPVFQVEALIVSPAMILSVLAISTLVFDIDWKNKLPWTLSVVFFTISSTFLDLLISNRREKEYAIAQEIFQEQLLLEKPRYKELKKCYYHGGEKYKEKLLSTEKFLRLIKKREKYLIRRDKNNRYIYKSGFNPQNNISPTRNSLP
ncbi:Uncharacterised protein [Streptococcus sanguinis]|uniref:Uncharacterized protein n=1 Tax=Streptococcus sanguinis TaxID=1305 RepID=A0AAJ5NNZ3_STRSA|nr:hypothetical protein [Streptococcus sanguinis]VDY71468.1 Uncharacterised protein [Streptococcus sanguinis]